jgi:hypothetical protein
MVAHANYSGGRDRELRFVDSQSKVNTVMIK